MSTEKKPTLIDSLKPKQKEAQRIAKKNKPPVIDPTEKLCEIIINLIKEYVREEMLNGREVPDIHHYYYSLKHRGVDVSDDQILRIDNFDVFTQNSHIDLNRLSALLKERIINEIGYKYCEILLEDKILKEDYQVKKLLSSDLKWQTKTTPGKAIWIHASMTNTGFSKVLPQGKMERYDRRRGLF